jgi:hypothetical protein
MKWILYGVTLPYTIVIGYGWVLLMGAIYAAHKLRWERTGVLTAQWRPWAAARWRYSTTLGRGIIYWPGARAEIGEKVTRIQEHEHVHVRQVEDLMLLSFLVGLVVGLVTGNWWLGFALWASGGVWQLPNFVTASLRHGVKNAYRVSEHERSAYAQTDARGTGSWLSAHLKKLK